MPLAVTGRSTSRAARPPSISRRERTLSYVEAVREATDQEMARDPSVVAVRPGRGRPQGDPGHDARPGREVRRRSASSARRCPRTP